MKSGELAECLFSSTDPRKAVPQEGNVADALFAVAGSIEKLARAVEALGTNGAGSMGAIELLAKELRDGLARMAIR